MVRRMSVTALLALFLAGCGPAPNPSPGVKNIEKASHRSYQQHGHGTGAGKGVPQNKYSPGATDPMARQSHQR